MSQNSDEQTIRWTASTFFNHLQGLDASHFEDPPALAATSSSSLAQQKPLRTSLDSSRLAALEVRTSCGFFLSRRIGFICASISLKSRVVAFGLSEGNDGGGRTNAHCFLRQSHAVGARSVSAEDEVQAKDRH